MISKETCVKIWNCHNEIEKGRMLIEEMAKGVREHSEPTIHNAFGEKRGLELGVPSGNSGHRIYGVPVDLAVKIIEAHIESMDRRLEELSAIAKIELYGK